MKIHHLHLIVTMMLLISLCACQSVSYEPFEKYDTKIIDVANDGLLSISDAQTVWSTGYFEEESLIDTSLTINFDSNEITGKYYDSLYDTYESFISDRYRTDNNIVFSVRRDTGDIVALNFMTLDFFDTEPYLPDVTDPDATALEMATQIAKDFLKNLDDYTVEVEEPDEKTKEKDGITYYYSYHRINFIKYIDGYHTTDYLSVTITSKGNLAAIVAGDIGAFDGVDVTFNKELVEKSVSDKIHEIYESTSYTLMDLSIEDSYLAVTPDGKVCIGSDVGVSLMDIKDSSFNSGVRIITEIGEIK